MTHHRFQDQTSINCKGWLVGISNMTAKPSNSPWVNHTRLPKIMQVLNTTNIGPHQKVNQTILGTKNTHHKANLRLETFGIINQHRQPLPTSGGVPFSPRIKSPEQRHFQKQVGISQIECPTRLNHLSTRGHCVFTSLLF